MLQAAKITGKIQINESPAVKGAGSCTTVGVCAYRSLIQLKGGGKGVHESQIEMPSKQLVKVRCCDSIWPADSITQVYHALESLRSPNRGRCRSRLQPNCCLKKYATNTCSLLLHFFRKGITVFVVKRYSHCTVSVVMMTCLDQPCLLFVLLQDCVACLLINSHSSDFPLHTNI